MRAAPQKESRLEMEEELGEVREVIRRGGRSGRAIERGWTTPRAPEKDFCEDARSARSIESQSNKAETDVEMRSLKGRKEGRQRS